MRIERERTIFFVRTQVASAGIRPHYKLQTYRTTRIDRTVEMALTDLELMYQFAEDDSPRGILRRQQTLESWISAGVLTPKETYEAGRVLKLLRQRGLKHQPSP